MNAEELQQSPPIEVPETWRKCVLKGLGGGIGQAADAAMVQELRVAVGEHVRARFGREATDKDVRKIRKIALQPNEPADIRTLAQRAVRASERAAIKSVNFFEGLMTTMVGRFGITVEVNYRKGFARFGKPRINRNELPAFLAELARQCPELRVTWQR